MKKYEILSIEVIALSVSDVITASIEETKNQYDD